MKEKVKHSRFGIGLMLLTTVFFGSLFSSCYTKDDVPVVPVTEPTEPATYTVNIAVVGDDDKPLAGVQLFPQREGSVQDLGNGMYSFTTKGAGSVVFCLVKEGYKTIYYTVNLPVAEDGTTVTVPARFYMDAEEEEEEVKAAEYNISGRVFNGATDAKEGVVGAQVKVTLRSDSKVSWSKETDDNGIFNILSAEEEIKVVPGIYDVLVTKEGMNDVRYSAVIEEVAAGQVKNFNLEVAMYEEGTVDGETFSVLCNITSDGVPFTKSVKLTYVNEDQTETKDVNTGVLLLSGLKKGNVTIYAQVKGSEYNEYMIQFKLEKASVGQILQLPINLSKAQAGTIAKVVTPDEDITIETPESSDVEMSLNIPAGSLDEIMLVSMEADTDVKNAVLSSEENPITGTVEAAAAFVTGTFAPSMKFNNPITWSVENPYEGVAFNNLKLQYKGDDEKDWSDVDNTIIYGEDGFYITELEHFSSYRMVVTSTVKVDTVWESVKLPTTIYNGLGKRLAVNEGKFTCTVNSGSEYEVSVESALNNAGIPESVKGVLTAAMAKVAVGNGVTEKEYTGSNSIEIEPEWVYIPTGKQAMLTKTYTFRINDTDVNVVVKEAGMIKITGTAEPYNQHHHTHGGHFTDGGAGGGAGE